MAESNAFKNHINESVVDYYADGLEAVFRQGPVQGQRRTFDGDRLRETAVPELDALELKDRVKLIATTLHALFDEDYLVGLDALLRLIADNEVTDGPSVEFAHWPIAQYIEMFGVDHLEESVAAMEQVTQHFSCEFAVRPFLDRYPDQTMAIMRKWAVHDSVHVRRNASEGIRPRLPWGMRLKKFVDDPEPVLTVLGMLRKDPEEYVRRSVSNCLNDIAKDHPERLMDVLEQWDQDPDEHSEWIKRRALRTLVKAGDARALSLLGFGPPQVDVESLEIDAPAYTVGETMTLSFSVANLANEPQKLAIDYRVHFRKANGTQRPKVFKLKTVTLEPDERLDIVRRQHLKPISTRKYYAGNHAIDVQINGQVFGRAEFVLHLADDTH